MSLCLFVCLYVCLSVCVVCLSPLFECEHCLGIGAMSWFDGTLPNYVTRAMHSARIIEQDCCICNTVCAQSIPCGLQWESRHSPVGKHGSTSHMWVVRPSGIPLWYSHRSTALFFKRAVVAFPCGSHRSTAPFQGGLLFVSTRDVSQAVYQPPSCLPAGGVGGHACPRSWLTVLIWFMVRCNILWQNILYYVCVYNLCVLLLPMQPCV